MFIRLVFSVLLVLNSRLCCSCILYLWQCVSYLWQCVSHLWQCVSDYVFCQLHRLPEQHDCIYDHKGKGRQDARDKMVSPKKHIGTSLKRIDSNDSWLDFLPFYFLINHFGLIVLYSIRFNMICHNTLLGNLVLLCFIVVPSQVVHTALSDLFSFRLI